MVATIAAIASPPGPAARGVIRVSGVACRELVERAFRGSAGQVALAVRGLHEGAFDDGVGAQPALLVWMPGPRSFTREDVAEFHLPGAPPLLARALARLVELGARIAEPGEFTRRAFESGRIDLTRAEGVLELIRARDRAARRAATALLAGGLSDRVEGLRDELEDLRALCEASLDFDQDDTGHVDEAELHARALRLRDRLLEAQSWETRRAAGLGLPLVVLAGSANAGKSSLFNALCGERALVSGQAGTTRDVLRARWDLPGGACELVDTAGLEEARATAPNAARAELDAAAAARARSAREAADLCLWVVDGSAPGRLAPPGEESVLTVWNQCDREAPVEPPAGADVVRVSARTGAGLEELAARTAARLGLGRGSAPASRAGLGRELSERHRASLSEALDALDRGCAEWREGAPLELFADHLRRATDALDGISGRTTPEDLLDRIFGQFCLGK